LQAWEIKQGDKGVEVSYSDSRTGGTPKTMTRTGVSAPFRSVLSQIPMNVGAR